MKSPLEESELIWRLCTEEGIGKRTAISILFEKGKIDKKEYKNDCPLCETYNTFPNTASALCLNCPWPGDRYMSYRCEESGPYLRYFLNVISCEDGYPDKETIKKYARPVHKLLQKLLEEEKK